MGQDLQLYEPVTDEVGLGPCMRDLVPRQRAFVYAMLDTGMANYGVCARMAGYTGDDRTIRVTGHRLAHNERILAAIQEEARKRIGAGALMAASKLLEVAMHDGHKDQMKAVFGILDRAGLHAMSEHKVTVDAPADTKAMISRISDLAQRLGMDPVKLLGQYGVVVDAEFTEIPKPKAEEPFDDLADLLG